MSKLTENEQAALRNFNERYRAALAREHLTPEQTAQMVRDAVQAQYDLEQQAEIERNQQPPQPDQPIQPERKPPEPEI